MFTERLVRRWFRFMKHNFEIVNWPAKDHDAADTISNPPQKVLREEIEDTNVGKVLPSYFIVIQKSEPNMVSTVNKDKV